MRIASVIGGSVNDGRTLQKELSHRKAVNDLRIAHKERPPRKAKGKALNKSKKRAARTHFLPPKLSEAVVLSGAMLSEQDSNLRYLWVSNPPAGYSASQFEGRTDEDIFPPETAQIIVPAKRRALESGLPQTVEFQMPLEGGSKWFELRIAPMAADGKGIVCAAIDIDDRKQAEYHMRILLLELAHRSKNLLAVIQGIANRTSQASSGIADFTQNFSGRLMSLSRAHDVLTDEDWRGAAMAELIRTQVLLFAGTAAGRIDYDGDPISLRPAAAQHIGLALYELTANALKFGALSNQSGRVTIGWSLRDDADERGKTFSITWTESGGPEVAFPTKHDFGRVLLEEVVPASVQGKAQLTFTSAGIEYRLDMPVSELLQEP